MASVVVTDSNFVVADDFNTSANQNSYSAGMREFGMRLDGRWGQASETDRPELIFDVFSGLLADGFKVYRVRENDSDNLRFKVLRRPQFSAGNPNKIVWQMVLGNGSSDTFEMVFRKDLPKRMVVPIPKTDDIQGYQSTNVAIIKALSGDAPRDFIVAASLISRCR